MSPPCTSRQYLFTCGMEQQGETRDGLPLCLLCGRVIPPGVPQSRHHLVPRLRGGKGGETVLLHQICHDQIHATLSETELARSYHTITALRAHPDLARFLAWVAKRPADFRSRRAGPGRRGRKRG